MNAFEVPAPYVYSDVAAARRANLAAGPSRAAINHAGLDAVSQTLVEVLDQFVQPDGSVRIANVFRVVLARA